MNFDHEELMLMMLYNTGTRLGLVHELWLMQCYLMPVNRMPKPSMIWPMFFFLALRRNT